MIPAHPTEQSTHIEYIADETEHPLSVCGLFGVHNIDGQSCDFDTDKTVEDPLVTETFLYEFDQFVKTYGDVTIFDYMVIRGMMPRTLKELDVMVIPGNVYVRVVPPDNSTPLIVGGSKLEL